MIKRLSFEDKFLIVFLILFAGFVVYDVFSANYDIHIVNLSKKPIVIRVADEKGTIRQKTAEPEESVSIAYIPEPNPEQILYITDYSGKSLCTLSIDKKVIGSLNRSFYILRKQPYLLYVGKEYETH